MNLKYIFQLEVSVMILETGGGGGGFEIRVALLLYTNMYEL